MGWNGVDALPLAEVPYLASIVTTASCNMVSAQGWRKNMLWRAGVCTELPHKACKLFSYPFGEKLTP